MNKLPVASKVVDSTRFSNYLHASTFLKLCASALMSSQFREFEVTSARSCCIQISRHAHAYMRIRQWGFLHKVFSLLRTVHAVSANDDIITRPLFLSRPFSFSSSHCYTHSVISERPHIGPSAGGRARAATNKEASSLARRNDPFPTFLKDSSNHLPLLSTRHWGTKILLWTSRDFCHKQAWTKLSD